MEIAVETATRECSVIFSLRRTQQRDSNTRVAGPWCPPFDPAEAVQDAAKCQPQSGLF